MIEKIQVKHIETGHTATAIYCGVMDSAAEYNQLKDSNYKDDALMQKLRTRQINNHFAKFELSGTNQLVTIDDKWDVIGFYDVRGELVTFGDVVAYESRGAVSIMKITALEHDNQHGYISITVRGFDIIRNKKNYKTSPAGMIKVKL